MAVLLQRSICILKLTLLVQPCHFEDHTGMNSQWTDQDCDYNVTVSLALRQSTTVLQRPSAWSGTDTLNWRWRKQAGGNRKAKSEKESRRADKDRH